LHTLHYLKVKYSGCDFNGFDEKIPEEIQNLWITNKETLKNAIESRRFEVGFNTTYLNPMRNAMFHVLTAIFHLK